MAGSVAATQTMSASTAGRHSRRRANRQAAHGAPHRTTGAASGYQAGQVTIHASPNTRTEATNAIGSAVHHRWTPPRRASQAPTTVATARMAASLHRYDGRMLDRLSDSSSSSCVARRSSIACAMWDRRTIARAWDWLRSSSCRYGAPATKRVANSGVTPGTVSQSNSVAALMSNVCGRGSASILIEQTRASLQRLAGEPDLRCFR